MAYIKNSQDPELHPGRFYNRKSAGGLVTLKKIVNDTCSVPTDIKLIDTHCHLDMDAYTDDLDDVLFKAFSRNILRIVTIGIDLKSSKDAVELAKNHPQISATIGIHPHEVDSVSVLDYQNIQELYAINSAHIIGFGEIGLDYVKLHSSPDNQRKHFARQLEIANDLSLPVIIHNREANEDTLDILKMAKPLLNGGIMHCFSGDFEFAKKILDLGLIISIPGTVTFKNAQTIQDVAKNIPLSSFVIETDGPFLAPHPFRGKRNEPAQLIYTAQKIAELRQMDLQEIATISTTNAEKLFNFAL